MTCAGLCAGCVPADVPPQLAFTPGPAVIVDAARYQSTFLSVRVPQGWRIVTAPAEQPDFVIFVAPDNDALMQFSARPIDPAPVLNTIPQEQQNTFTATRNGLYALLVCESTACDRFAPLFKAVVESLQVSAKP